MQRALVLFSILFSLMLAAVVMASCGDDDDDDTSGSTQPAPDIKLGLIYSIGGPAAAQFTSMLPGINARIGMENEKGGVNGSKLVIVEADDQSNPAQNLAAARDLVENKGVFGMIEASPVGGSGEYLKSKGTPVVGWAINPEWATYDNMFSYNGSTLVPTQPVVSTAWLQFAKDRGVESVAILGTANPAGQAVARLAEAAAKGLGLNVGYLTVDVPSGGTDFTADVQRIKAANADGIMALMPVPSAVALYQAVKQAGLQPDAVLSPTGYDPRLLQQFGAGLESMYFSLDFAPYELNLAAHGPFTSALAKYGEGQQPDFGSMVGWLSADVFIRGLKEAGAGANQETFIQKLRDVKDYTADGLLPPVDFQASFGQPTRCFFYVQVKDGKFSPFSNQPVCGAIVARP